MKIVSSAVLMATFISLIGTSAPINAQVKTLGRVVKDAGYRLYEPPRENWGPGTVFLGRVSGKKLTVDRVVCPSLFATVKPSSAGVLLPDYSGTSDSDLNLGISLLDKVVGPENSASLKAGYKAPRNVSIKWGPITEQAYFASSVYSSTGQTADVDGACRAAMADIRRRGQLERVFVIDRALNVSSLTYTFKRGNETTPSGGSIGGDLKIAGLINVSASAGFSLTDESTLVVNRPLFVAYAKPIRFSEFAPQAQVSGSSVKVRLKQNSADLVVE